MSLELDFELDDARELMYEDLIDEFGAQFIEEQLDTFLSDQVTQLYDNRDQLRNAMEQAQQ